MPAADMDWKRLASYVVSARVTAGYKTRRSLAAATGITDRTIGTLETGHRVGPETLAIIERAVGWKPDSARQVLQGGEPLPVGDLGEDRPRFPDDPVLDQQAEELWNLKSLPVATKLAFIERARQQRQAHEDRPARRAAG